MAKRKTLTFEYVKQEIKNIKEIAKTDFEMAHGMEIGLYKDVLTSIANGQLLVPSEVQELAKEALKASKIKFTRVTA